MATLVRSWPKRSGHGCVPARRPEGSRAMKKETREEWAEVFRDGWPIFLANMILGALLGYISARLR